MRPTFRSRDHGRLSTSGWTVVDSAERGGCSVEPVVTTRRPGGGRQMMKTGFCASCGVRIASSPSVPGGGRRADGADLIELDRTCGCAVNSHDSRNEGVGSHSPWSLRMCLGAALLERRQFHVPGEGSGKLWRWWGGTLWNLRVPTSGVEA